MKILSKLYVSMETHLAVKTPHWDGFACEFRGLFDAEMVLYRVTFPKGGPPYGHLDIIATSNVPVMQTYMERRLFEYHKVPETMLAPLEPQRGTDFFSEEELQSFGPLSDYMKAVGMRYVMIVPAILSDGAVIALFLWRGPEQPDFNDLEKQRAALAMRYLLAIVEDRHFGCPPADSDVVAFGREYGLTPAEIKILGALIEGASPKAIARSTGRSYGTIRWHVQNILEKCHSPTQRQLLADFYRLFKK